MEIDTADIDSERIFEKPVHRISRRIREEYWSALKRTMGAGDPGETHSGDQKREESGVPDRTRHEMYGWDSYFIVLGLLSDGNVDIARSIVDNCVSKIRPYGTVAAVNRTHDFTRAHPPFLTSMGIACYGRLPRGEESRRWLARTLETSIAEYHNVWMNTDHLTPTGLSRYFDSGNDVTPGADRGHRESGHYPSYRLFGCCADLVTVDLNSLLYKIESDIASVLSSEFGGTLTLSNGSVERSATWRNKAEERKELMNRYLWHPGRGMFFDYDFVHCRQSSYVSATAFYTLWAGLATNDQARRLLQAGLPLLETAGGVAGSSLVSRGPVGRERPAYKWDFPYGWAPHQMLLWQGLMDYGYDSVARRLAYKWLFTISLNALQDNGTIPERFDVEQRTHDVVPEYGDAGTAFSHITREPVGWTHASYQVGLNLLSADLVDALNRLVPPEWVFLGKRK